MKLFIISNIIMNCGYPNCRCKIKMYGVCGRHKNYAYTNNTKEYIEDMKEHKKIIYKYKEACDEIERSGGNVLCIQVGYDNNLCGPRTKKLPEIYESAAKALEATKYHNVFMQNKYKDIAGKIMISNSCARACQEILDPGNDSGLIYQLGKNVNN